MGEWQHFAVHDHNLVSTEDSICSKLWTNAHHHAKHDDKRKSVNTHIYKQLVPWRVHCANCDSVRSGRRGWLVRITPPCPGSACLRYPQRNMNVTPDIL